MWQQRLLLSSSLACQGSECTDTVIASVGEEKRHFLANFTLLDNAYAQSVSYEAAYLGLDGVMHLQPGRVHALSGSRFCIEPPLAGRLLHATSVLANVTDGRLFVEQDQLGAIGLPMSATPAADCDGRSRVELFPPEARVESVWLHATPADYQHGHGALEERREATELAGCASAPDAAKRMSELLKISCSVQQTCRAEPSVPFRRACTSLMRLNVSEDGDRVAVEFMHSRALEYLPGLEDSDTAVRGAGLRILLLALTALVIFVRSGDTHSANRMFFECIVMIEKSFKTEFDHGDMDVDPTAAGMEAWAQTTFGMNSCVYRALASFYRQPVTGGSAKEEGKVSTFWVRVESCALGLLAIGTRMAVCFAKARLLAEDGNMRLVVSEVVASCLSLTMWIVRWFGTDSRHDRTIILGGSTAHLDAAAAVLLEFVEAPLRSETYVFASIARMLIAVVLVFAALVRLLFSVTCCFMLADGVRAYEKDTTTDGLERYAEVLTMYGVAWMAQAVSLGVLLTDAFVVPATDSMTWNVLGNPLLARIVFSLVMITLSLPTLNYVSAKAAERVSD
jgi:hypothetical protein